MTEDELKAIEARIEAVLRLPVMDINTEGWVTPDDVARADAPRLVAEVRRSVEVIRAIIYASDHCQGHKDCAHSMSPWMDARELLYEFENEQEALTELRRRRHGDYGRTGPMT
jgi:hypothetical protein